VGVGSLQLVSLTSSLDFIVLWSLSESCGRFTQEPSAEEFCCSLSTVVFWTVIPLAKQSLLTGAFRVLEVGVWDDSTLYAEHGGDIL
jgi:hypothetical protein